MKETADFLLVDKPAGVTTHASEQPTAESPGRLGFVEYLSARLDQELFVVHRLDLQTTGCLVLAKNPAAAEAMRQQLSGREVEKKYLFLTDRKIQTANLTVESWIERGADGFVSVAKNAQGEVNARTDFELLESDANGFSLWQATPLTGKPHQIRLHAESIGLAILGDIEHGGSRFPSLCLHALSFQFEFQGVKIRHESSPPVYFRNRERLSNTLFCRWLASIDRRERLGRSERKSSETFRWIHSEGDPLRVEQLGDVHWLTWYDENPPNEGELELVRNLATLQNWQKWLLQLRAPRPGQAPLLLSDSLRTHEPNWTATEGDLRFEFRLNQGLSPGLFLDQRQNRTWVREHSQEKTVLNLFCYTGGFSVAAASGGASNVVSVDVSKNFLEWAKCNFAHNSIELRPEFEFRAMDSIEYLNWARKKGLRFDLVICDPPSFSRSKSGVFSIDNDFEELFTALVAVTQDGGRILFATNYEKWTLQILNDRIRALLVKLKRSAGLLHTPEPDWDFELPGRPRNMKSTMLELSKP